MGKIGEMERIKGIGEEEDWEFKKNGENRKNRRIRKIKKNNRRNKKMRK